MSDDLSMTALEYALGTLPAGERADFVRLLENDADARAALADWEQKLAPLGAAVEPVEPDDAVWRGIEQRLDPPAAGGNVVPLQRAVRRWRFAATAASALAAGLALYVAVKPAGEIDRPVQTAAAPPSPSPVPRSIPAQARANEGGSIATASASRQNENLVVTANGPREGEIRGGLNVQPAREVDNAPAYVAALAPASAPAALIVQADTTAHMLVVRRLSDEPPAGTTLRLWLIAPNAAPRSLGIAAGEMTRLALPRDISLSGATIAASIEPTGATSDAPSGPFAYEGRLVRD